MQGLERVGSGLLLPLMASDAVHVTSESLDTYTEHQLSSHRDSLNM
jgi:hypothetical protein